MSGGVLQDFGVLDRWADGLCRRVTGRWALVGLVVFMVFTATVLPWQASITESYAGEVAAPDTALWYSADDLYAAAESWGDEGRSKYVMARATFDVVWPLVYGFFLVTSLAWLFALGTRPGSRWRRVALLPILVVLLDYAENICTATVMARYPNETPVLADIAGVFTAAKWTLLSACFVLLVVGGVSALRARSRRSSAPDPDPLGSTPR